MDRRSIVLYFTRHHIANVMESFLENPLRNDAEIKSAVPTILKLRVVVTIDQSLTGPLHQLGKQYPSRLFSPNSTSQTTAVTAALWRNLAIVLDVASSYTGGHEIADRQKI
jgi:hypothetical protein